MSDDPAPDHLGSPADAAFRRRRRGAPQRIIGLLACWALLGLVGAAESEIPIMAHPWLVTGPFPFAIPDAPGADPMLELRRDWLLPAGGEAAAELTEGRSLAAGAGASAMTRAGCVDEFGVLDFASCLGTHGPAVAYATTTLISASDRMLECGFGCAGGGLVALNGRVVHLAPAFARPCIVGESRLQLPLLKGANRLLVKVWCTSPEAYWRFTFDDPGADDQALAGIAERIDRVRRRELELRFSDAQGRPLRDATVEVEQVRHAFHFGTAVNPDIIASARPGATAHLERVAKLFSSVTPEWGMEWSDVEVAPGLEDHRRGDRLVRWAAQNGLHIHGHCLLWNRPHREAAWVQALPSDRATSEARRRLTSACARYAGAISDWTLLNEPAHGEVWSGRLGWDGIGALGADLRRQFPGLRLMLNDFDILTGNAAPRYLDQVRRLVAAGGLDLIGIQEHTGRCLPSLTMIQRVLDRFAATGLPIAISEFSTGVADENLRADQVEHLLMLAFAHPAVESFTFWGVWDQNMLRPESALWRGPELTETVLGQRVRSCIRQRWWTQQRLTTNAEGRVRLRAFAGDHVIRLATPGGTQDFALRLGLVGEAKACHQTVGGMTLDATSADGAVGEAKVAPPVMALANTIRFAAERIDLEPDASAQIALRVDGIDDSALHARVAGWPPESITVDLADGVAAVGIHPPHGWSGDAELVLAVAGAPGPIARPLRIHVATVPARHLRAEADTQVAAGTSAAQNFAKEKTLEVKMSGVPNERNRYHREAYIRFALDGQSAPPQRALLRLHGCVGDRSASGERFTIPVGVAAAEGKWDESGLTWLDRPRAGAIAAVAVIAHLPVAAYDWDVSELVRSAIAAGRPHLTLVVSALQPCVGDVHPQIVFSSREDGANGPELLLFAAP